MYHIQRCENVTCEAFLSAPVLFCVYLLSVSSQNYQFIDAIKLFLFLVVIETVVPDTPESLIGDVNDHLLEKLDSRFRHIYALFCLMAVVIPADGLGFLFIGDQSAFCHGRTGGVAHHITHASGDIFGKGSVGCFGIGLCIFCVNIETFILIYIASVCLRIE